MIVPEYVEITETLNETSIFQKGLILKTEFKDNGKDWRFVWPDNTGQIYLNSYEGIFKASTEEAYCIYHNIPFEKEHLEDLSYLIDTFKKLNIC